MATTHRIRRLRLRVPARSGSDAFAMRGDLRAHAPPVLELALGRAFDELAPGEERVHLSRLELHITLRAGESLLEGLDERVYLAARAALRDPALLGERAGLRDVSAPQPARANDAHARRAALRAYLERGDLAWSQAHAGARELASWLRDALPEVAAELWSAAVSGMGKRVASYFRALQLLGPSEWLALARAQPRADAVVQAIEALAHGAHSLTRYQRLSLAAYTLAAREATVDAARSSALRAQVLAVLATQPADHSRSTPAPAHTAHVSASSAFEATLVAGGVPLLAAAFLTTQLTAANVVSAAAPVLGPQPNLDRPTAPPPLARRALQPPPDAFARSVAHAGLVLLHPFLPRMFATLGLFTRDASVLAAEALPRAAALACFLACGEEEVLEHELGLVKVMLGLTPETPLLIATGLLAPAERDEAQALLRAVIDHWKALRATSPAGLRTTFLSRRGLLSDAADGFSLRVESSAFDVLLAQLPWGTGVIKLPWMARALFVEWAVP